MGVGVQGKREGGRRELRAGDKSVEKKEVKETERNGKGQTVGVY
jgi:hypothetical protein